MLDAAVWPSGAAEKLFGTVRGTAGAVGQITAGLRTPFALVRPLEGTPDSEAPGLVDYRIEVLVGAAVAGDETDERALMGGNRAGGIGSSRGRGVLDLVERVRVLLRETLPVDGFTRVSVLAGEAAPANLGGEGQAATVLVTVQARGTAARSFPPPRGLTATAAGGGVVNLAWTLPASRFDRREVVLRRAAGATAPASVTAGTGVTLSGLLATSVADSPGAGQFSYALFAGYDQHGAGSSDTYSAQVAGTTRTVTAT